MPSGKIDTSSGDSQINEFTTIVCALLGGLHPDQINDLDNGSITLVNGDDHMMMTVHKDVAEKFKKGVLEY